MNRAGRGRRVKGNTKVREYAVGDTEEGETGDGGGERREEWLLALVEERRRYLEIEEGEQVEGNIGGSGFRVDKWGDEGGTSRRYVITVDYRESVRKGGTWPGGRATLQGNPPRGVGRKRGDDARYIYISYTLLAELHLFEQVNLLQLFFESVICCAIQVGKKKKEKRI